MPTPTTPTDIYAQAAASGTPQQWFAGKIAMLTPEEKAVVQQELAAAQGPGAAYSPALRAIFTKIGLPPPEGIFSARSPSLDQFVGLARQAGPEVWNASSSGSSLGAAGGKPGDVDQRANITAQIQDFYKRMTMPVTDAAGNITEPVVKQLATIGRSMGLQGASGAGIQGGAASAAGSASAMANALPYLQQRASLAAGANQLLQNGQLGYEASNQGLIGLNQRAQEMQNDVTQANYQNSVNRAQGTASTLGGVVGALAEFGLGIPGATKIGTNLAASLGGQTVAPPTYAPYKQNTGGAA